jgi:hypothetical protein
VLESKIAVLQQTLLGNESVVSGMCISRRNESATRRLQEQFKEKRLKLRQNRPAQVNISSDTLKVFCVSADASMKLLRKEQARGFHAMESTSIPQFREWLLNLTLVAREEISDAILVQLEAMQLTMTMWANESSLDNKILASQRIEVAAAAEKEFSLLQEGCSIDAPLFSISSCGCEN